MFAAKVTPAVSAAAVACRIAGFAAPGLIVPPVAAIEPMVPWPPSVPPCRFTAPVWALLTSSVPSSTVVPPVCVAGPSSVSVPAPALVRIPSLMTGAEIVALNPPVVIVPPPARIDSVRVVVQFPVSDTMPVWKFTNRSKPRGTRSASPAMTSGPQPAHVVETMFGPMNRACAWGRAVSGIVPTTESDATLITDILFPVSSAE